MKSKSSDNEKIDEKIVFIANSINHNNSSSMILISDFSQKQIINLIIMISIVMNVKLEQRFENFNINR